MNINYRLLPVRRTALVLLQASVADVPFGSGKNKIHFRLKLKV